MPPLDNIANDFASALKRCLEKNSEQIIGEYCISVCSDNSPIQQLSSSSCKEASPYFLAQLRKRDSKCSGSGQSETLADERSYPNSDQNSPLSVDSPFYFGGSPLKVSFLDLSTGQVKTPEKRKVSCDRSTDFSPVGSEIARNLLSKYALLAKCKQTVFGDKEIPPLWVICDGKDQEHTVYIGRMFICDRNDTYLSTYNIFSTGPFVQNDKAMLNLSGVMGSHFYGRNAKQETKASASYLIMGDLEATGNSKIMVDFKWSKVASILEIPASTSLTLINMKVVPGGPSSPMHKSYMELHLIEELVIAMETGNITWAKAAEESSVEKRLKKLMKDVENPEFEGDITFIEAAEPTLLDVTMQVNSDGMLLLQRSDMDFTDQLWEILAGCTSYAELTSSLKAVTNALQTSLVLPMVRKDNETKVAKFVHDSYSGEVSAPTLAGTVPLELLAEMGIQKLRMDYSAAFLSLGVVRMCHLTNYLQAGVDLPQQLCLLKRMHIVAEMLLCCKMYLALSEQTLGSCVRMALKQMEKSECKNPEFLFPVPTTEVIAHCYRSQAVLWKVDIVDESGTQPVTTSYELSVMPPFSHVLVEEEPEPVIKGGSASSMTDEHKKPYYCTLTKQSLVKCP